MPTGSSLKIGLAASGDTSKQVKPNRASFPSAIGNVNAGFDLPPQDGEALARGVLLAANRQPRPVGEMFAEICTPCDNLFSSLYLFHS